MRRDMLPRISLRQGLPDKCEIELAYAIGVARPVSVFVNTQGTGIVSDEKIAQIIDECFDLRPAAIIEKLDLRRPIYKQTAAYGHFGRTDIDLPWETPRYGRCHKGYGLTNTLFKKYR